MYPQETESDFSVALFPNPDVISKLNNPDAPERNHDESNNNGKMINVLETNTLKDIEHTFKPVHPNSVKLDDHQFTKTIQGQSSSQKGKEETEKHKPLMSFEEWQKKIMQIENDKDRRHKRKTLVEKEEGETVSDNKRQHTVDSIDGGFSDDFGSMFEDFMGGVGGKEKRPNVYDEEEYISPSHPGSVLNNKGDKMNKKNSNTKKQQFASARMKSLKERFNYASTDCAATVRKANKEAKGAQSILYESKDQYLLNKCSANKFVIINLCEQIVIDTLVMANFEFFSSTFKDFRVYASSTYPSNDWRLLGQWQARNTRDLQVFRIPESGFVEYIKIEFLTHYGNEYYCPLSLVRVHGMSMMEYYTMVESQDRDPVLESEHLWPADVREQIIQPQFDITNTSESFPVKIDNEEEEKLIIPPTDIDMIEPSESESVLNTGAGGVNEIYPELIENDAPSTHTVMNENISTGLDRKIDTEATPHDSKRMTATTIQQNYDKDTQQELVSSHTPSPSKAKNDLNHHHEEHGKSSEKLVSSSQNTSMSFTSSIATPSVINNEFDPSIMSKQHKHNSSSSSTAIVLPSSSLTPLPSTQPSPQLPKIVIPNNHQKEGNTQESIYKTIMKRLSILEINMTLSQRFLDDQNKNLNDVFIDMEKKHQEQLIMLIGHLNETASYKIDSMKRRYEQWYEDLKEQTENDMREMSTKIAILADQLSFERRVSVTQLVIMIALFVFIALSRGTFNTLSPVMAAQYEERKRRESVDQLSKETVDSNNTSSNSNQVSLDALVPSAIINDTSTLTYHTVTDETKPLLLTQKLNELPKRPINPRRYSDNMSYVMKQNDLRIPTINRKPILTSTHRSEHDIISKQINLDSLGIVEFQNTNTLPQRKLGNTLSEQRQQEEVNTQPVSMLTSNSSLQSLQQRDENTLFAQNLKRPTASPPSD
ncbi:UNC-like C-terminal-domain-containing protein [Cokeromyces recurvatus]|uniref:UNC-like C-terminal-domain-containing protein n=1 Tax=Cokeromyces recurvatus TaxID=90255 RepID=UPI00221F44B0|nr:UNC-like C-terminal-domain-containing protein [Cokeromyces recurvatus]KAI7905103.1 UNC-like C-terminal-domain-containing protein [Cokeromyces recurvatus]